MAKTPSKPSKQQESHLLIVEGYDEVSDEYRERLDKWFEVLTSRHDLEYKGSDWGPHKVLMISGHHDVLHAPHDGNPESLGSDEMEISDIIQITTHRAIEHFPVEGQW